jgi:hypothetical protein
LIGFAINSGDEQSSPGMLLSLLSLCLATLMAMFREDDLSMLVSAGELTLLIRETGTALLDARLSSSDDLSEDDRSQMIRAINKVRELYHRVTCGCVNMLLTLLKTLTIACGSSCYLRCETHSVPSIARLTKAAPSR